MLTICKDWLCAPIFWYSKATLSAEFSELCKEAELFSGKLCEFSKITYFGGVKERNLREYLCFLEQLNKNCSQLLADLKNNKSADELRALKISALELKIASFVMKLGKAHLLAIDSPLRLLNTRGK